MRRMLRWFPERGSETIVIIAVFSSVLAVSKATNSRTTAYDYEDPSGVKVAQSGTASAPGLFFLASNHDLFLRLFFGQYSTVLPTIPLCYRDESVNSTFEEAVESNVSWEQYTKLMRSRKQVPLQIDNSLSLMHLVELNEKEQTFTVVIEVTSVWSDCRLVWSLKEIDLPYFSIEPKLFNKLSVFTPRVRLVEMVNPKDDDASEQLVKVHADGHVEVTQEYLTTLSCNIDVQMYPFDVQKCQLTFKPQYGVWFSGMRWQSFSQRENLSQEMQFNAINHEFLGRFTPSEQWTVTLLPPELICNQDFTVQFYSEKIRNQDDSCKPSILQYTILLRRHPRHHLIYLLFPAFVTVVISGCVFILPPAGGEKMGLSVSSLLALFMFSQLLYEKMPETGSTIPLLSYYFLTCIGLVSSSCIYSAISAVFASASPRVPPSIGKFVRIFSPILAFDQIAPSKRKKPRKRERRRKKALAVARAGESHLSCNQHLHSRISDVNTKFESQDSKNCEITWSDFGVIFDRIFNVIHLLTSIIALVVFLSQGYSHWNDFAGFSKNETVMKFACGQGKLQGDPHGCGCD